MEDDDDFHRACGEDWTEHSSEGVLLFILSVVRRPLHRAIRQERATDFLLDSVDPERSKEGGEADCTYLDLEFTVSNVAFGI
jgi:hypothetical protein